MSSSNPSTGTGSNPSTSRKSGFVPPSTDDLDAILDQYEFLELIGRGGMGAVYKARQKSLDRLVAIKILPPNLTTDEEEAGFHFAERFQREAKAMAKLSHPHIIGVYDFGQAKDGQYYFVMEYVEGTDLHALIKGAQLTVAHVTGWMSQICDALQYAHGRGVVHRDIKPANIMITREGQVKVADFGLAKLSSGNAAEQTKLTMTNMAMGTPDYVAPEALEIGVEVDHRADLYALGVMLYEMLTGKVPRGAWKSPSAQIEGLDERYDAVIERAMDSDRESRFQQASEISATIYEIATTVAKPARLKLAMGTASVKSPPAASCSAAKEPTRSVKSSGAKDRTGPQAMPGTSRVRESEPPVKESKSPVLLISGLTGGAALVGLGVFFALFKGGADPVPVPSAMTLTGNGTSELAPQNPPPTTPPPVAKPAPPKVEAPKAEPSPAPPAPATPVGAVMPEGMVVFNGHRYQFFPDLLSWPEARTRAEDMGGHLATINSKEENDWIASQFVTKLPQTNGLWLGGTHDGTTGQWRWVTGEPFEFTQWAVGEPNPDGSEPALQFAHSEKKGPEWGDIKVNGMGGEDRRGGYLVEWDDDGSQPAPGAPALTAAIDLLALVDVKRDAEEGQWQMTPNGLVAQGAEQVTLRFPHAGAEEYDYEIEFTIEKNSRNRCVMLLPLSHGTISWAMEGASKPEPPSSGFGPQLDGLRLDQITRTEAKREGPALTPGQRYRCLVEVRKDSLRALLDGEELLKWSGDLKRFTGPAVPKQATDPKRVGLNTYRTTLLFHRAELRPPGGAPIPQAPAPGAATPSAPITATIPDDPRVAQLDAGFKARLDTDAENPFQTALAALNQSYTANGIARARATAQQAGKLDDITALDAEKALIESGAALPETDPETLPEAIKTLRATYRAAHTKLRAERATKAGPLYDIYLGALDAYIAELTKTNAIEQAKAVKAWRETVAARKPSNSVSAVGAGSGSPSPAAASPTPPSNEPTFSPAPIKAGGNVERRAAEFLVAVGGTCRALKGGEFNITKPEDIPSGRFAIIELNIDRLNSSRPPLKDADLLALTGLDALRRVLIRPSDSVLTDAAFSFIAGNKELTWINLEGTKDVTDAVLDLLADSTKLEHLSVQRATRLTGRSLAGNPFQKTLTFVDFMDSGIDDAGLAAIAACPNLEHIRVSKSVGTDGGFAKLGQLKKLKNLDAIDTRIGPQALAALAVLPDLEDLNLERTSIGDADIAPLAESKKLRKLNLRSTKATQAGIAALQKALPQCQIEF